MAPGLPNKPKQPMAEKRPKQFIDEEGGSILVELLEGMVDEKISKIKGPDLSEFVTAEEFSVLKAKLDKYPDLVEDGNTYGIRNGELEIVAGDNEVVLVDNADTALSLTLESLSAGQLMFVEDEEMMKEVHNLLGDELWNELSAQNVSTLALKPSLSAIEQVAKAKEAYYQRKERIAKMEAEKLAQAEKVEAKDVEPLKGETE